MYGLFNDISTTIDYTLADLIKDIVDTSNEQKILYHGIKDGNNIDKIKENGLMPLTPESGYCSFWATGVALFNPPIDSPFFRYSGSNSTDPLVCELNLAMANYNSLSENGISLPDYRENSQILIHETVPYESIALIRVKVSHPQSNDQQTLRKYRQTAEQLLLRAIITQTHGAFSPGEIMDYSVRIGNQQSTPKQ